MSAAGRSGLSQPITLVVENEEFIVPVDKLVENSDFFKAMLSGRFSESDSGTIALSVVSASGLKQVCHYLEFGSLPAIETIEELLELARCTQYLQMGELLSMVCLEIVKKTTVRNWVAVYNYALATNLEYTLRSAKSYGLTHFDDFKSEISTIEDSKFLYWYLSNTQLNVECEYDVFLAGIAWGDVNVVALLHCIDFGRKTLEYMDMMIQHETVRKNEAATSLLIDIQKNRKPFDGCKRATRKVFLVSEINAKLCERCNASIKNVIPLERKRRLWGQSVLCWRRIYLISVCGQVSNEFDNRKRMDGGAMNRDIQLYDGIEKCWKIISRLPEPRRHAGVAIHRDQIYIVGGTGVFRKRLNSILAYDIINDIWKKLPSLPDNVYSSKIIAAASKDKLFIYCNALIYLDLDRLTWHELNSSGLSKIPVKSMIFQNNVLFFGTSIGYARTYNLRTGHEDQFLRGIQDINLFAEGTKLYGTLHDTSKTTIIRYKQNLNRDPVGPFTIHHNIFHCPNTENGCLRLAPEAGLFVLSILDNDDNHIKPYNEICDIFVNDIKP